MGGKAISNTTRINQTNVDATLDDIYEKLIIGELHISPFDTSVLGSTGKKLEGSTSGDIDMAIDVDAIVFCENTHMNQLYDGICDIIVDAAKKYSSEIHDARGIGTISLAWPIQNGTNPNFYQQGQYVQLDLMPTDCLDWAAWSFYAPHELESSHKGVYRNQLLVSITKFLEYTVTKRQINDAGIEVDVEWERYFYDLGKGIFKGTQSILSPKTGKIVKTTSTFNKKIVTNDTQEAIDLLLGPHFEANSILTWNDVWAAFISDNFIHKEKRKEIVAMTINSLENLNLQITKEMTDF